jgi:hypothetical protein
MLAASVHFLLVSLASAAGGDAVPPIPRLEPAVTRRELEAHVRWLASDDLLGRVTGTPQCDLAARYLASVLEAEGVEPAGDGSSFLQAVPLERQRLRAAPKLEVLDAQGARRALVWGADFDVPWAEIDAHDLRLVVVRRAEDLPKEADAHAALFLDAGAAERRRWLSASGLGAGEGFGALLVPGSKRAGRPRGDADLTGPVRRPSEDGARAPERAVRVHGESLEGLRRGDVRGLSLRVQGATERLQSANVVGRIPGRGDAAQQAVVVSAHYDHISGGHGEPAKSGADTIYNGADDDASGVAIVLEIAGALAHGERPAHTVIVLLATGEEVGLLGTEAYLERPAVPLERTLANLNFEMLGRPDALVGGPGVAWLTGDERTNLGAQLRERGLAVRPDPRPEQRFFERSDNYAFVLRGVVGQTFSSYDLHADYHTPRDEADRLDFEHLARCAATGERAARLVAGGEVVPAWAAGAEPRRRDGK